MRKGIFITLTIVSILVIGLSWFVQSNQGLTYLVDLIQTFSSQKISVSGHQGKITGPLKFEKIIFDQSPLTIEINNLELDWNPTSLFAGKLALLDVAIESIDITHQTFAKEPDTSIAPSSQRTDWHNDLNFIDTEIRSIDVNKITFHQSSGMTTANSISLAAKVSDNIVEIENFAFQSEFLDAALTATIDLQKQIDHRISIEWKTMLTALPPVTGETLISGNINNIDINQIIFQPTRIETSASILNLPGSPEWIADVKIPDLDLANIQEGLPDFKGAVELQGSGDSTAASFNGTTSGETTLVGPINSEFNLTTLSDNSGFKGIEIQSLVAEMFEGTATTTGTINFEQAIQWNTITNIKNINSRSITSQPGLKVDGNVVTQGEYLDDKLDVNINITAINGTIENRPFNLNGQLNLSNQTINIDQVNLASGQNTAKVWGVIGEKTNLHWSVDAAAVDELEPDAQGSFTASGKVTGILYNPSLSAIVNGDNLGWRNFQSNRLQGEINIRNWVSKEFDFDLQTSDLLIDNLVLESVTAKGDEKTIQSTILSKPVNAEFLMVGNIIDNGWQGQLVQSDIASVDFDNWKLIENADIEISAKQLSIGNLCLVSDKNARACNQLSEKNNNLSLITELENIPIDLFNLWLPNEIETSGTLNAKARIDLDNEGFPSGNIDMSVLEGKFQYTHSGSKPLDYPIEKAHLHLKLLDKDLSGSTLVELINGDRIDIEIIQLDVSKESLDTLQQLPLQADIQLDLTSFDFVEVFSQEVENLSGRLQSTLQLRGSLQQPEISGTVNLSNAALNIPAYGIGLKALTLDAKSTDNLSIDYVMGGLLNDADIQLDGTTRLDQKSGWPSAFTLYTQKLNLTPLVKEWLPTNTSIDGSFDSESEVEVSWPTKLKLKSNISSDSGAINTTINGIPESLSYDKFSLDIDINAKGANAVANIEFTDASKLNATYNIPVNNIFDLNTESQTATGEGRIDWNNLALIDRQVQQLEELSGKITAYWKIEGKMNRPDFLIDARLDDSSFYLPEYGQQFKNTQLTVKSVAKNKMQYQGKTKLAGGEVRLSGETIIDGDRRWNSQLNLDAKQVETGILIDRWLPPDLKVNGKIDSTAKLQFEAPDLLTGNINFTSNNGLIDYPLPTGEIEQWNYQNAGVQLQLSEENISVESTLAFGSDSSFSLAATLPGARLLSLDPESQKIIADSDINFHEIELLEALIPEADDISGRLALHVEIDGTMAKPRLDGNLNITNASFGIPRIGLSVTNVNFDGRTEGDSLFTFKGNATSGEGQIDISGESTLDASKNWPTKLTIQGENFEVSKIPEASVKISPDLNINTEGRNVNVKGSVRVPYAKLQPKDVTSAVRVSEDTIVIGGEEKEQSKWSLTSNTDIILGNRVNFFGFGFEGQLGGRLTIMEEPGQLTRGVGEINIVTGRYRAYGQYLDIENGRLIFTGGPVTNPGLDVRAIRVSNDVTTGILVRGRLNNPKLELFSQPAMGQTDVLAYLLLGGPIDTASGEDGALMAKAALALGLAGGDQLARSIGDKFGFDEMRIESSEGGDQASMVVGRYLSPKLYVSYGVGLIESFNSLNLRYQISNRWQLKAESGENHGADVLYVIER